jgi:hypothetical protein
MFVVAVGLPGRLWAFGGHMDRNATVTIDGTAYKMALLGRDADAVAVPGGIMLYLATADLRDGGGKVHADGKVGQLTSVADSGGFRAVAGVEGKVSVLYWEPRRAEAVAEGTVSAKSQPAGASIRGRK